MEQSDGPVRRFHAVDEKFREADFFFERFASPAEGTQARRFYLSAFAAAARSVTYALQWAMSGTVPEFSEWYEPRWLQLKSNAVAKFFHELRITTQKRGPNPAHPWLNDDDTATDELFFFRYDGGPEVPAPSTDIAAAAKEYMACLAQVLFEAYRDFGHYIDRDVAWTIKGIAQTGLTVDQIEEQSFGMAHYRASDEVRLERARRNDFGSQIDDLLRKWLGHDRFGRPGSDAEPVHKLKALDAQGADSARAHVIPRCS